MVFDCVGTDLFNRSIRQVYNNRYWKLVSDHDHWTYSSAGLNLINDCFIGDDEEFALIPMMFSEYENFEQLWDHIVATCNRADLDQLNRLHDQLYSDYHLADTNQQFAASHDYQLFKDLFVGLYKVDNGHIIANTSEYCHADDSTCREIIDRFITIVENEYQ